MPGLPTYLTVTKLAQVTLLLSNDTRGQMNNLEKSNSVFETKIIKPTNKRKANDTFNKRLVKMRHDKFVDTKRI